MLVTEIKSIAEAAGLTFRYGNPFEINAILDQLTEDDYPVLIYFVPVNVTDSIQQNNLVNSSIPFVGALLTQHSEDTVDYDSETIQSTIDSMRDQARNFVYQLNAADFILQDSAGITTVSYPTLYSQYDDHLLGVGIECTIPVSTGKTYCT